MKDYYATLGVSPAAGESEIKKAFRRLAVRYHPDKNPSEDAKHRFQEINEAYDVLGDAAKRAAYDAKIADPLAELFSEPVIRHRDPAYRRGRTNAAPRKKEPPASYLLMRDSLKYVIWISRIALVFTTLFFIDFLLPYQQVDDSIADIYVVKARRSDAYHVIVTGSGKEIKVYNFRTSHFSDDTLRLTETIIYGSVMSVSNSSGTFKAWVAYMYSTLIFFPITLFVNSLLALVYRKRVEFCFNLNVTAFILLIINLILL